MKTVIVAIDFSADSTSTIDYAIAYAKAFAVEKMILYYAYEIPVTGDPLSPVIQMFDYDVLRKTNEENFHHLVKGLKVDHDFGNLQIEEVCELNDFSSGLNDACIKYGAELVFVSITQDDGWENGLFAGDALTIAKNTIVPVIVVPQKAVFKPIEKVLLACDFKKIIETTPIEAIRDIIGITKAKLLVLNVNHTGESYSTDMEHEIRMLDGLLKELYPAFHFIDNEDFMQGINQFVDEQQVDIVVTIPKKHGFFEKLFRKSHVKMLAFHSHVPLMVIHD